MLSLKHLLICCFSLLSFLFGYLIANYHHILTHDHCQDKGSSSVPLTRSYIRSESTRKPAGCVRRPNKMMRSNSSLSLAIPAAVRVTARAWAEINPHYRKKVNNIAQPRVLSEVFAMFHHPSSPLTSEVVIHATNNINNSHNYTSQQQIRDSSQDTLHDLYDLCDTIYLTRTGSLANMPNKCLSVGFAAPRDVDPIPHSHRRGKISGMVNMYQADFIKQGALRTEKLLLPLLIESLDSVVSDFLKVAGNPLRSDGSKRSVMVMVLNEGVIDVFFNFVCSCKAAGIEDIFDDLVVILGQENLIGVINAMGVKAFYSAALGPIPKKAAQFYGDLTFGILMWFKITSVYLAHRAGFHVLFQDVDLVWMENPLTLLEKMTEHDIIFMDDGARTPRFTPFYFNSGFYFVRHTKKSSYLMERMLKTISEIAETHSHQSTLTKYFSEVIDFTDIHFHLLANKDYPSGYQFHHEKDYIEQLVQYKVLPKVFHMCWTESRDDKVKYLKQLGLWFLPENDNKTCYEFLPLEALVASNPLKKGTTDTNSDPRSNTFLAEKCCQIGNYWEKRKQVIGEPV